MTTVPNIETIIQKVLKAAGDARDNAGYSGSHGDGGASGMEAGVAFYRAGMRGVLPDAWKAYAKEVLRESDPEYSAYLRLHKKFGD
jgi:hypothetical protein